MKKLTLLIVCLFTFGITLLAQDQKVQKEKELIKEVIQSAYVDGLCNNADEEAIKNGFHPEFTLLSIRPKSVMGKTRIDDWTKYAKRGKERGFKYSFQNEFTSIKYQFIDVTGTAAVAKIDFYEGGVLKFIDYISLLKFEDKWKIVSKTYFALPKDETAKK
jgi:hypothetical protein